MAEQTEMSYKPRAPFVRGSDTSEAAAASVEGDLTRREAQVLEVFKAAGAAWCTTDEVEARLGLTHQSVSARVSTLAKVGRLVKSEARRKTRSGRAAAVYVLPEWR